MHYLINLFSDSCSVIGCSGEHWPDFLSLAKAFVVQDSNNGKKEFLCIRLTLLNPV